MLSQREKDIVKETVPVLRENGVALTTYFYNRMLSKRPELKETFNMGNQRSGAQAQALAEAVLAYAENIEDPSVLEPVVNLICHKHVSLNIKAPDYPIVGENLLHSISEVLSIPMEDELIKAWGKAYNQLADLFIETEAKIYLEQAQDQGSWLGWRKFIVSKKVDESDEITSFYLIPEDKHLIPTYKAGQYITLRVFVPELGFKQPRQYTLSSAPNKEYLRISVKKEVARSPEHSDGYVSNVLHAVTKVGDSVELSAPTGNFFLINSEKTNVFISAGVGLTPMVAMLNQALTQEHKSENGLGNKIKNTLVPQQKPPLYFIHAARNSRVHALKNELLALKNQHENLKLYTVYQSSTENDTLGETYDAEGFLDLAELNLPKNADYYLCGPIPFMQIQNEKLLTLGIPQEAIHTEAFGTGGTKI